MTSDVLPPTNGIMYLIVPGVTGSLAGLGAGLITAGSASNFGQVVTETVGVFLMAASVGFTVAVIVVQQERAKWWEYKTALAGRQQVPSVEPIQQPEQPVLIMTPKGLGYFDKARNVLRIVKVTKRGGSSSEAQRATQFTNNAKVDIFETVARVKVEQDDDPEQDQTTIVDINRGLWIMAQHGAADPNCSTAEADWQKFFEVKDFRNLRDALIQTGFAEWNSPRARTDDKARRQGWHFTARARAVMRGVTGRSSPPPPRKIAIEI